MKRIKSIVLVIALLLSVGVYAQEKQNNFEIAKSLDIYNSLLRELNLNYVDEINPGELNETAIKAMLDGLDPYTVFIPESDIENAKFMTTGEYGGIGALIQYDGEYTRISEPYFGWPAQKAGLIAGDVILEVNGVDCKKKNTQQVSEMLKGQPGTELTMKVKRYGEEKPLIKVLKREKVKIDNIPYYTVFDNGIAYLSLSGFTRDAAKEMKEKLVEMKKNHELKGFILDLRGNGGGLMNEAVDIVNLFVPKGKMVVSMRGKAANANSVHPTTNEPVDLEIPLAVLVDGNSASASEIVAGAIQDYDRGVIIGERTFGKGLVQNILPLSYNTQMKVTVAHYYIPSGRCIQEIDYSHKKDTTQAKADTLGKAFTTVGGRTVYEGHGITPDVKVKRDPYATVTAYLYGKSYIFDYANKFYSEHKTIDSADRFQIDEVTYQDFMKFVKDKNFSYTTESEKAIEKLKKVAKDEGYLDKIQPQIDLLEKNFAAEKENDLISNRKDIEELLRSEIVGRYYFQKGRIISSLNDDPDLKRAFEILLNTNGKDEYHSILSGK
ncbi:MAG: S41 family peptidase [Bacteroidales bacterium]|nr:S41 family peptidase [Bacteroidales bacterium]